MIINLHPGLYQGGSPLMERAVPAGMDAMISLALVNDLGPKLGNVEHVARPFPGVKVHLVAYIEDGPSPGLTWLKTIVASLKGMIDNGLVVYVHCAAGWSLSVMVCSAFLMQELGLDRLAALRHIYERNPNIAPAPAFINLLKEYDEELNSWRTQQKSRF